MFRERALLLRYTYTARLVILLFCIFISYSVLFCHQILYPWNVQCVYVHMLVYTALTELSKFKPERVTEVTNKLGT